MKDDLKNDEDTINENNDITTESFLLNDELFTDKQLDTANNDSNLKEEKKTKNKQFFLQIGKLSLIIFIIASIAIGAYFILRAFGLNNIEKLKYICNTKIWGALFYIFFQIFQVIFIPIGTVAFTLPAIIIFGPLKAFFISWIGITIGSIIIFFIGRYGGSKLINWVVGKEKGEHYKNILTKGKFLLPLFLLIPIFPDDILCAAAGMSKIKSGYFIMIVIITRCIDMAFTSFVGAAAMKTWWGILLMLIFFIIMGIVAICLTKKQDKIEQLIVDKFKKKDKI